MNPASSVREVRFSSRFIGPDGIVNGGYLAGILEREIRGPVEVTFRKPTPPERRIELHAPDGATRELRDGDVLLVAARRRQTSIEAPAPVPFELASEVGGAHAAVDGHPFPRCFVCGPERAPADALCVFPGATGQGRVAAPVVFSRSFADDDGIVACEHVAAVLDCPGGWAIQSADAQLGGVPMLLAQYVLRHEAPVRASERCVVVGLASGADGRKRFATTALYGEDGTLRSCARCGSSSGDRNVSSTGDELMNTYSENQTAPLAVAGPSNPVLSRINAIFFAFMDRYMHWKYAEMKRALFTGLPDVVVELGAGAGANFRYFRPGTKVIAVEPNPYMHPALRRASEKYGIALDVRASGAERIDLPSESVDAVVTSLVLCTVADQKAAIAEAMRLLRAGGKLLCIEHVAAPERTFIGKVQRLVFRPWRWFFEGCHTHRHTEEALRSAGFSRVEVERVIMPTMFVPIRPHIVATCTR